MDNTFHPAWWSVQLPVGWNAREDSECVTFQAAIPIGAVQISAARKGTRSVTEAELMDFAKDESESSAKIAPVTCGEFAGFAASLTKDGRSWSKLWLCHKDLVIFVTYNVSSEHDQVEYDEVWGLLKSFKCKGSTNVPRPPERH